MPKPPPVFVFTRDQEMLIFWDEEDAGAWLDQEPDAAEAVFDAAGTVLEVRRGDADRVFVALHRTPNVDPGALRQCIQRHLDLTGSDASPDDPQALADDHFRQAWEHRWPKWPRWLDQRIHGGPLHERS